MADDWVPRVEAADRAGVHRNTILDWERRGLVKTRRAAGPTGSQVVVRVADLERVMATRADRPERPEVAELRAEIRYLRERLAEVTAEREALLQELLTIARGRPR